MGPSIREEFRLKNFGLSHSQPNVFVSSQWGYSYVYLLWRIIWPIYHLSWIIASGVLNYQWATSDFNRIKWFVYLTNWTYLVLTLETILEVIILVYVKLWRKDIIKGVCYDIPWFMKMLWVFYNIATTASFLVTVLYWSMIFKGSKGVNPVSLAVHGLNSVYVILNMCFTAMPVRILHFYQPVIYGVLYTIFTAIYYGTNGTNMQDKPWVYPIMDWSKAEKTVVVVLISNFIAIPVMHCITYFLYFLRVCLYHRLQAHKSHIQIEDRKCNLNIQNGHPQIIANDTLSNNKEDMVEVGQLAEQNSKTNLIVEKF